MAQLATDSRRVSDLKATGVKTVESLREGKDDLPHLQGTKLSHVRIPTRTWNPEEAQLVLFLKILEDPKNWPVFVHCVEGRSYSVATYRPVVGNWSDGDEIH